MIKKRNWPVWKRVRLLLAAITTVSIVSILVNRGPIAPNIVVGNSMAPSLLTGDIRVLDRIYPRVSSIKRGDIVVFLHEGELLMKRVYGLPGDTICEVWLTGTGFAVMTPFEIGRRLSSSRNLSIVESTLAEAEYYLLGDNVDGCDSREFGPVLRSSIVGLSRPFSLKTLREIAAEAWQGIRA